jgi:hypothetical protein
MIFTRDEVQAGQIRRVTVRLGDKHKGVLGYVDRGAIRPVVYAALSKGVVDGHLGAPDQGVAGAAGGQHRVANQRDGDYGLCLPQAGFLPPRTRSRSCPRFQEEPASGVPMCHRAAPAATVGLTVLPLMLFHQIQLTVCASLARRYAARPVTPQPAGLVRLVGVGISDRVVRGGHAKALQAMPSWERRLMTRRVVRELGCMPADQSLSGMYSPFS